MNLPSFTLPNTIDLVSVDDSKILNVSLYSNRAEIQRLYKMKVKAGQNQVNINGLPNSIDHDSIRVEGDGPATIHEVTISNTSKPPITVTSDIMENLSEEKDRTEKALERAKKEKCAYGAYLSTLDAKLVDLETVDKVVEHYDSRVEILDAKILNLGKKIEELTNCIVNEQAKLFDANPHRKASVKVTITLFAKSDDEVSIVLIYAVMNASWKAAYDIRVNMKAEEKRVTVTYQAKIKQDTHESWDNVPLTLETASPTFGVLMPTLVPWKLNVHHPPKASDLRSSSEDDGKVCARKAVISKATYLDLEGEVSDSDSEMDHRSLDVTSGNGINATFQVPGSITIPSDGVAHNVTVTQLELAADISWITVPKVDARVHLRAKINNASDYTLLPGVASIFVDGSFISRSDIPLVSPLENFDCPLGLDRSIRITYHPLSINVTESGFYTKSSVHILNQRITIVNTKSIAVEKLKVLDQLPISESSQIVVKPLKPSLFLPENSGDNILAPEAVKIADGVTAQWEGADEPGSDAGALGKDGRFYFMCVVPPQGKLNLLVAWEVTAPINTRIRGL